MNAARSSVPLAEIHCHLEGTVTPAMARRLALRNGIDLAETMFDSDGGYAWDGFLDFLRAFDEASETICTPEDYRDLTLEYLAASAAEGALYVELMCSPDHARTKGLGYRELLEGIARGVEEARGVYGIEARLIVNGVRHLGPERVLAVARQAAREPHPLVVGFGMAGDENAHHLADFTEAFETAREAGLGCTVHAGELAGAESVRTALDLLPVSRIGHGIRAVEDPELVRRIADEGIVLEVCPGSNLATGAWPDVATHPFAALRDAGCRVTLNSDDPPFFDTSIGREYAAAREAFGLGPDDLMEITRAAIEGSFADRETKDRLLKRLPVSLE